MFALLAWVSGTASAGTLAVDMLDVGQGDSILITSPAGKRVLIDAGDNGVDVVTPLRGLGVTGLDLVVATHPHADHIGGMDEVLQSLPVKLFIDNGLPHDTATYAKVMTEIETRKIPYKPAAVGQVYRLDDDITLTVLNPGTTSLTGTRSDLNANSVVIRMDHGSDCFLFTGDSEDPTEQAMLSRGVEPCDVLKVAHHGSEYSTSAEWLRAVQPRIALISVGTDNKYHHPGQDTLQRLVSAGAEVHRTDLEGTLHVTSDGHDHIVVTSSHLATAPASPPMAAAPPSLTAASPVPPTAPATIPTPNATAASAGVAVATTAPLPAGCLYEASSQSEVFHEATCGMAKRISEANRVCYATRDEALAAGKRPAGCCKP